MSTGGNNKTKISARQRVTLTFLGIFFLVVTAVATSGLLAYFTATSSRSGDFTMAHLSLDIVNSSGSALSNAQVSELLDDDVIPGAPISLANIYVKNSSNKDVYSILKLTLELYRPNESEPSATYSRWTDFSGSGYTRGTTNATVLTAGTRTSAATSITIPGEIGSDYMNGSIGVTIDAYAIQKDYLTPKNGLTTAQYAAVYLHNQEISTDATLTINGIDSNVTFAGDTIADIEVEGVTTDNSCGWFYDADYTQPAHPTDVVNSSTQLYTKSATTDKISGTSTITAVDTNISGEVVIPQTINGVAVTSIAANAFKDCDNVTSVIIPVGVTSIGANAFYGCDGLESISIPNTVSTIGASAFMNSALEGIDFDDDMALASISNEMLKGSNIEEITIPNSVTSIGGQAFAGCVSLTTVNFEDNSSLNSIGEYAFWCCSSLTELAIPSGVRLNGAGIFRACSSLTDLDISRCTLNTSFSDYMFAGCYNLTSLNLGSFDTSNVRSMANMFYGCSGLQSLDLSNFNTTKVTNMYQMFCGCSGLTSLNISNFNTANVTSMSYMFYACASLTNLDLSGFNTINVTNMSYMLSNCSNLTTIYASDNFATTNVTNSENMFRYSSKLVGGNGTTINNSYLDKTYARIDATGTPGYFTAKPAS